MYKKRSTLALFLIFTVSIYAQYDDDLDNRPNRDSAQGKKTANKFNFNSSKYEFGTGFMITAQNGIFFGELTPFVGKRLADPLLVGIGVKGAGLFTTGSPGAGLYGAQAFTNIFLGGDRFFFHGEYGIINAPKEIMNNLPRERVWASSPIAGIGFQNWGNYILVGWAFNREYQKINPYGGLIYRFVLFF